ncbi:diguanylate cyclase [Desulfohalobium retbaense]|uniref:diguanylate cyclase n=1 Tax=Desulfohalobium retbaense (strain ATCC 49708 / DSM 5692 / JCM 16813 / HR100) TaxID=485915 RepID=C8X1R3_DESRD|nr:diguanylate cyclase [Desulfohalobium retbaense]ACV68485.1 diguanylate cyclase with PAS/PAC sensor [Desulfohalobium retbaense DSM 5692]
MKKSASNSVSLQISELEAENARLRAELAIARDELETIFDHSMMGVALVDHNRKILTTNQRFLDILGYTSLHEILGQQTHKLHVSHKDFEGFGEHYDTTLRHSGVVHVATPMRRKDGSEIWLDLVGRAIDRTTPPDLSKGVLWMAYDLTDIRQAYQQLREANAELEGFFANCMIGIIILRGGRRIRRVNQRLADILGDKPPEWYQGKCVSEFHVSQEKFEEFGRLFYNSLVLRDHSQVEFELRRVDGSPVWVSVSGKALDDATPPDLDKGVIWMVDDISTRKEAEEQLARIATTDSLTNVSTRQHFMELANRALAQHLRNSRPLTVCMLDIDHFKQINDTYGHGTGDRALAWFAETVSGELRATDIIGRFGGEEFCIVLPETDQDEAQQVAHRIRTAVTGGSSAAASPIPPITVSIGIALADTPASMEAVIQLADRALYAAKAKGRNRAEIDETMVRG